MNKCGPMIDTYYIAINVGLGTSSCRANSFSELGARLPCIESLPITNYITVEVEKNQDLAFF